MRNTGKQPPHELVDVKYRCGVVTRGIKPEHRRWKPDPKFPPEWEWDIVDWQASK